MIFQVATHSCLVSKDNTRLGELGEVHMMSSSADQSQVGEQHGHVDIEGTYICIYSPLTKPFLWGDGIYSASPSSIRFIFYELS